MKKYVFITNSTKPSLEKYESLEDIELDTVSRPCLKIAKEMGYDVILGVNRKHPEKLKCSEMDISFYNSHTFRSIFSFKDNYIAYKNLCELLKEGDVEVIHCNTPIGGFVGRICGKKYKVPKIIYTAHGFHFYKGAPLLYNTLIKWIEFFLAHWTDVIITINEEDYQNAKKMKLRKNGKVYKLNGVGIDVDRYKNIVIDKLVKRNELGLKSNDFICIGLGRLEENKNYSVSIKAISKLNDSNIHFIICGDGPQRKKLEVLSKKLGVDKQIHFLGFRTDVDELLSMSDCYISTSKREGLPRALMEAMACGLPCIVSKIRGNVDLLENGKGGYVFECMDINDISDKIRNLINNRKLIDIMKEYNLKAIKSYDVSVVKNELEKIYEEMLGVS